MKNDGFSGKREGFRVHGRRNIRDDMVFWGQIWEDREENLGKKSERMARFVTEFLKNDDNLEILSNLVRKREILGSNRERKGGVERERIMKNERKN